jgi:TetR/AcrR family transcriptional regulator, biofilm operon repressor
MTKKEILQQRINTAAIQCFSQYGLEKTTLDDIAKLVGLNKATFYYYYKNKEEIFLEVALQEGQQFITQLQATTLQKKSAEQRITYYLIERIRYYRDVLTVNKVSANTIMKILPTFFVMYEEVKKAELLFISNQIKTAIANKEFKKIAPDKLALALLDVSDAMKHKSEQDALIKKDVVADYEINIQQLQFLLSHIFNSIQLK